MRRMSLEIAGVVMMLALALEVIHYRNAVLAANLDLKRAWHTVVALRVNCEKFNEP